MWQKIVFSPTKYTVQPEHVHPTQSTRSNVTHRLCDPMVVTVASVMYAWSVQFSCDDTTWQWQCMRVVVTPRDSDSVWEFQWHHVTVTVSESGGDTTWQWQCMRVVVTPRDSDSVWEFQWRHVTVTVSESGGDTMWQWQCLIVALTPLKVLLYSPAY